MSGEPKIGYTDDRAGTEGVVRGSDGRWNTSARTDGRIFYNARDRKLTFNFTFEALNVAVGEYFAYWKNISSTHELVFNHVGLNAELAGQGIQLVEVDGDADGDIVVPKAVNLNQSTASAHALCRVMTDGTGIEDLAEKGVPLDYASIEGVYGHEELRILDTVRLHQDEACALKLNRQSSAADCDIWGLWVGYYELKKAV